MRLTFKRIEIHNFMSFADEVFDFPTDPGLNLICGKNNDIPGSKNGAGKSSVTESLLFSLFGQTKNNLNNANIHNKYIPGKDVRVVTYFDVDARQFKVASGMNKNGSTYCELIELTKEGEIDLSKSSIAETREFLTNEIIHCDMSIFLRTVLLSSDQNYNFFRLRKGEKKEFIEKLFDLQVFGQMYSSIHKDVLNSDKDINVRQSKLMLLNEQKDEYNNLAKKYESDTHSKLQLLREQLSSIQSQYDVLKNTKVKTNDDLVNKYTLAINKINDIIVDLNDNIRKNDSECHKLTLEIQSDKKQIEQKRKLIEKHKTLIDNICDRCQKVVKDYFNIDVLVDQISDLNEKISQSNLKFNSLSSSKDELTSKLSEYQQKIDKANAKIYELTQEANKVHQQIGKLESLMTSTSTDICKLEKTENPYEKLIVDNDLQLKQETKGLESIAERYKYLKFAENIVSQDTLRKFIISDLVGLLNNKIKMYLTKFGAKYHVLFDSDMNYTFVTPGGNYEYDNFSSGERARIMIAACFAFRDFMYIRNNMSCNIMILDEFIDGAIDSLAIESILNVLKEFSENWKQNIFAISHRKEIGTDAFKRIIQIQKTNNISKIMYLDGFDK